MALPDGHQRYCCVTFLQTSSNGGGQVYCAESDAWEQCVVGPTSSYSSYGEQVFTRDQTYQRDQLLSLLHAAFNHGREHKRKEVLAVLGVPL